MIQVSEEIRHVDLPIKRSTATRKTYTLGNVRDLAKDAAEALAASQSKSYVLINQPIYVVLVDQYAVDLSELDPEEREAVHKALQNAEVAGGNVSAGVLTVAVRSGSEETCADSSGATSTDTSGSTNPEASQAGASSCAGHADKPTSTEHTRFGGHHWVPGPEDHHGSRPMVCQNCGLTMKKWREEQEKEDRRKRTGW